MQAYVSKVICCKQKFNFWSANIFFKNSQNFSTKKLIIKRVWSTICQVSCAAKKKILQGYFYQTGSTFDFYNKC